jgi:putative SOS response-associated peptidase YedK
VLQRCLIPAAWYQEPNWETGKNVWWQLRRQDGEQWAIAGLWSEWTDRETGEVVPNYTMLTINCDDHPMLSRLHRPDPALPPDAQDKRAVVHVPPEHWDGWLRGDEGAARALLRAAPQEDFDPADAMRTDELLRGAAPAQASLLS